VRLIELVQSFENRVISPQARADVPLQVWQRSRRLPPVLRLSEPGAAWCGNSLSWCRSRRWHSRASCRGLRSN